MNKLDLHGTKHEDVKPKVIGFLEDHWAKEIEVEIITGHSKKMLDLVLEVVLEYKLEYRFGNCYSQIKSKVLVFME
jgi:hypothetical protein